MSISAMDAISNYTSNLNYISKINSVAGDEKDTVSSGSKVSEGGFDDILKSFMGMINETDSLIKSAETEEMRYAAGADNTLELLVAQNKASVSLQYAVAVRDKVLEAYKEIMQMQF